MIKIIDKKRYNTETAELLCAYTNGYFCNDLNYRSQDLYRTSKGAFFMHHEGGAMSDMGQSCGTNSVCGSEDIELLSEIEARCFLEKHSKQRDAQESLSKYFNIEDA